MEEKKKINSRNKNFINIITLVIFASVIIIADLFLVFDHNRTFSPKENRILQQAPEITGSGLVSGKFMTLTEDFVSDQFVIRDAWISFKTSVDKLLGKREANGIYLGSNGYLLEKTPEINEKNFSRNMDAIRKFASSHDQNIVMSVIPGSVSVCSYMLPFGAPDVDHSKIIERIRSEAGQDLQFADVTETLKNHNKEYIYYKSDHHWTSLGAKYSFEAIAPYIGIDSPANDYTVYCVSEDFSGTLSAASGASEVKDDIDIYIADPEQVYVVEYVGENFKSATIYKSEALLTNSKYEVFFGGNHPLVKIKTSVGNDRNLLVIKDSYANSFIQFLLPYFDSVSMVDPRYYSEDIEKLITDGSITDILFLYSVNTFIEDNSLAGILQENAAY